FDGDNAGRRAARKALDAALPFATDVRTVKFLFLPAEHDPDSYIREHGQEAFAAYVSKAVPLSRFMLEAAAEGCDLDTAEGRAHMASNARPLWSLLPDGAMKPQLLAEIADKVMIDSRDLLQLWQPASAKGSYRKPAGVRGPGKPSPTSSNQEPAQGFQGYPDYLPGDFPPAFDDIDYAAQGGSMDPYFQAPSFGDAGNSPAGGTGGRSGKFSKFGKARTEPGNHAFNTAPRRVAGRVLPVSRADHAARLMLSQPDLWETLTSEQHTMLAELPAPHGPLFVWMEIQLHEHGPQPWAALREGLRGHALESLAVRLMSAERVAADADGPSQPSAQESGAELRQLLN
ncbi:MAG: DNA primase, partial [Comamonadaceae bacterium]